MKGQWLRWPELNSTLPYGVFRVRGLLMSFVWTPSSRFTCSNAAPEPVVSIGVSIAVESTAGLSGSGSVARRNMIADAATKAKVAPIAGETYVKTSKLVTAAKMKKTLTSIT